MGHRLLVVDSDRRFLQDHKVSLESAFDVEFRDGTEGTLSYLEGGAFAAILLCVEASENKGYSLCSAIRRSPVLGSLKIALISAKATAEEYARHQSLKGRADLYLHKPIRSNALVSALTPLVPLKPEDPDNPLGDLGGSDLGDEWLDSLRSELEIDAGPGPGPGQGYRLPQQQPQPPLPAPSAPVPVSTLLGFTRPLLPLVPQALQSLPPVAKDAGRVELLEARVRDLETKLVTTSDELDQRKETLEDLTRTGAALRAQVEELTRNEAALQARVEEKTQHAAAVQAQLEETARGGAALQAQLEEKTRNGAVLQAQLEAKALQAVDLETRLAGKESALEQAARELEELAQHEQEARDQLQEKAQLNLDLMESNQLLQAQLAEGKEDAERLGRSQQALEGRVGELVAERQQQVSTIEELQASTLELRGQIDTLEQTHERQQMELLAAIDDREARIGRMEAVLEGLRQQIQELEQEKEVSAGALQRHSENWQTLTGRLAELESQVHQILQFSQTENA